MHCFVSFYAGSLLFAPANGNKATAATNKSNRAQWKNTHLAAAENERSGLAALLHRHPGCEQNAQCRECGALAEPHQNTQNYQRNVAAYKHPLKIIEVQ